MKILVIGSGGREHAMCRALRTSQSHPAAELLVAPGNPGTGACGRNVNVAADNVDGLVELAERSEVDLVLPGPELPLVLGVADRLAGKGIPCCGPDKYGAQLEGSKLFTRELGQQAGVAAPRYQSLTTPAEFEAAVHKWQGLPVLKADGLAAGKGVFLPDTKEACIVVGERLLGGELGEAGRTVLLEERLIGTEASLFYACHGEHAIALPHARDHKRLGDADTGPNTGGMGAISPNPCITAEIEAEVRTSIVAPVLKTLCTRGHPFIGFLYAGLMLTKTGIKLLEFNVRMGDPEAQAVLPRLAPGEFTRLCHATATGALEGFALRTEPRPTCTVVVASAGYPGKARKGDAIELSVGLENDDRWLDHAGTALQEGALVTSGGRVAAVVAHGDSAQQARAAAYNGVSQLKFKGMQFRSDIGAEPRADGKH